MSPRARNRWRSLGYALADGGTMALIFWLLLGQPRWLGIAVLTLAFLHRVAGVMQVERRLEIVALGEGIRQRQLQVSMRSRGAGRSGFGGRADARWR